CSSSRRAYAAPEAPEIPTTKRWGRGWGMRQSFAGGSGCDAPSGGNGPQTSASANASSEMCKTYGPSNGVGSYRAGKLHRLGGRAARLLEAGAVIIYRGRSGGADARASAAAFERPRIHRREFLCMTRQLMSATGMVRALTVSGLLGVMLLGGCQGYSSYPTVDGANMANKSPDSWPQYQLAGMAARYVADRYP